MKANKLADILGYQLDFTRHAALRSLNRYLADGPLSPASLTALMLVRDRPGCDQTILGRAMSGNRSVGMKVASKLEDSGLLERGEGRDRRSKGLYITRDGEQALARTLRHHARAEAVLAARLAPGERDTLLRLLAKVCHAIHDDEREARANSAAAAASPATSRRSRSNAGPPMTV